MLNNNNASMTDDFVQFIGTKGQLITTPLKSLTLLRGKNDYIAYFGRGGRAEITETMFAEIHTLLGLPVPEKVETDNTDDKDDGDDDLTFNLP